MSNRHENSDALANLHDPAINTFDQRGTVKCFELALRAGEKLDVVAQAQFDARLLTGILGLTTTRVLFVRDRVLRSHFEYSVPLQDIARVGCEDTSNSGRLEIVTREGQAHVFSLVRPKARAWSIYGHLQLLLEQPQG